MLIHQIVNNAIFVVLEENFVYKFLLFFLLGLFIRTKWFLVPFQFKIIITEKLLFSCHFSWIP